MIQSRITVGLARSGIGIGHFVPRGDSFADGRTLQCSFEMHVATCEGENWHLLSHQSNRVELLSLALVRHPPSAFIVLVSLAPIRRSVSKLLTSKYYNSARSGTTLR